MKVVVTRPFHESADWLMALTQAGHDAIYLPLIEIGPVTDSQPVQEAWAQMASFDAAMFVSGNAVSHFFAFKPPELQVFQNQSTIRTRALVPGPASQRALLRLGAQECFIDAPAQDAVQYDSEALWQVMGHCVGPGWRVLVVRGVGHESDSAGDLGDGQGRDWFAQRVRAAGGSVEFVVAYERRLPAWSEVQQALALDACEEGAVWLMTSSQAVRHLQALQPLTDWSAARAVVTHPRIGEAALRAGFARIAQARPTLPAVLASIESLG